jgi:hypothetical protein
MTPPSSARRHVPLQLVNEDISPECAECLEYLKQGVESGQIVGWVIGVVYKRRRYAVKVAGAALHDPTFSRGVVSALDDELRDLIHDGHEAHTPPAAS